MKTRMISSLLTLLLAALLFSVPALSEGEATPTAIDLYDMSLTVNGKTYTLPLAASELAAMGVNVPDLSGLREGTYYPSVGVDDGRTGFALRFDYVAATPGDAWATGVSLVSSEHAGLIMGGMVLGSTTMGEVLDACGPDQYGSTGSSSSLYYSVLYNNNSWHLEFDGSNRNAKLIRLIASSSLPSTYGPVDSSLAGVQEDGLPAASELSFSQFILDGKLYSKGDTVQKLLDNGWAMPAGHSADSSIAAISGSRMSGDSFVLYNGVSLVKVYAYNPTAGACALADCPIHEVVVSVPGGPDMICADGLQPGVSTYEDAVAILGNPSSSSETNGLMEYKFSVINTVTYTLLVDENGLVVSVDIRGLI